MYVCARVYVCVLHIYTFMYIYTRTCTYTYMRTYIHIYTFMYIYMRTKVPRLIFFFSNIYIHVHICGQKCLTCIFFVFYTYIHSCTYLCGHVHVYVHICTYTLRRYIPTPTCKKCLAYIFFFFDKCVCNVWLHHCLHVWQTCEQKNTYINV